MSVRTKYWAITILFVAAVGATVLFHFLGLKVVTELASIPAIVALFGALFQMGRDSIAFERAKQLEEERYRLIIGTTSHMANVVFDKHVEYCEKYVAAALEALTDLFRLGPHEAGMRHANALLSIRQQWTVWLTPEIELTLERFEGSIRKVGANAHLNAQVPGEPNVISEMFAEFASIFGSRYGFSKWKGEDVPQDHAIETVIIHLREVLGIGELTRLRSQLIKRATSGVTPTT